jgi:hypothetical protein
LGRAVTMALWRAKDKPPVELVVANLKLISCTSFRYQIQLVQDILKCHKSKFFYIIKTKRLKLNY